MILRTSALSSPAMPTKALRSLPSGPEASPLTVPHRNDKLKVSSVVLHIRCRHIAHHREDLCAVFDFPSMRLIGSDVRVLGKISDKTNVSALNDSIRQPEQLVLVRVVEIAQD